MMEMIVWQRDRKRGKDKMSLWYTGKRNGTDDSGRWLRSQKSIMM